MSGNIKDKIVLVTGGANGIGFSCVTELLRNNAKCVVILDLPTSNGEAAVAKLIKEFGKNRAIFMPCDVTNAEQMTSCFKKTLNDLKGLDIVINNAGIANEQQWERMIAINFAAVVRGSLLAVDLMGKHKGGKGCTVVNMCSICGLVAVDGIPVYSGTKYGVLGFTRAMHGNYSKTGVRFLSVCPGVTKTDLSGGIKEAMDFVVQNSELQRLSALPAQPPENVGRAVIDMIEKAESGTVCVSWNNEPPYQVDIPTSITANKPL